MHVVVSSKITYKFPMVLEGGGGGGLSGKINVSVQLYMNV